MPIQSSFMVIKKEEWRRLEALPPEEAATLPSRAYGLWKVAQAQRVDRADRLRGEHLERQERQLREQEQLREQRGAHG